MAVTVVAASIVAACYTSQPPPDVTADIAAANDAFMTAFTAGDGAGLAALYTEDARLLPPGADPVDGQAAIGGFWQSVIDSGVAEAKLMIDEVENFGDDRRGREFRRHRVRGLALRHVRRRRQCSR
jgi:hypothetical protein